MKKAFLQFAGILAVAAGLLGASSAAAATITGGVTFSGLANTDGPITTATAITSVPNFNVLAGTGDYAAIPFNTAGTMTGFGFNPSTTPITPLWSFTFGGLTYSFDLLTINVDSQTANDITLSGTGVAKITGFTDTPGNFFLTLNPPDVNSGAGYRFGFSSGVDTNVPEGGSAIALLGLSLLGLEGARRRVKAAKL